MNKQIAALWILSSILCVSLGNAHSTLSSPVVEAPKTSMTPAPAASETREQADEIEQVDQTEGRSLRRIRSSELNAPVVKKAHEIIMAHHTQPIGTDVEFEVAGKRYVGRIEAHYHPPGGELRPWGHHKGCSVYVVE